MSKYFYCLILLIYLKKTINEKKNLKINNLCDLNLNLNIFNNNFKFKKIDKISKFDIKFNFDEKYKNLNFQENDNLRIEFPVFNFKFIYEKNFIVNKFINLENYDKNRFKIGFINTCNQDEVIKTFNFFAQDLIN
jgi:hypothetical protein